MEGQDLKQLYDNRFKGRAAYRTAVWRILNRGFFERWIGPQSAVLDLGAGHAEFINTVSCGTKFALDLNPDTKVLANSDVRVLLQDCSAPWLLPDNSLDVVFTSNFFEHLSDKETLERVVKEVHRCLKPGGRLLAMGPNIKYLPGEYWDFWDHYIPLTEKSLSDLLAHAGFTVEQCIDKFLPYTMSYGPQYPLFFIASYLRLPLAWRLFGKQFFVVGRKI